jgi:hypothetical protein
VGSAKPFRHRMWKIFGSSTENHMSFGDPDYIKRERGSF